MAEEAQLIYLEPDDEITTVVRRLRETDARRLVLVASGRTKATTSSVALRLLAQVAAEEGREVVLVADAAARALAAEAGIAAFGTVAEASVDGAVPAPAPTPAAAPIHVVRGAEAPAKVDEPSAAPTPATPVHTGSMEETQAVRIPPTPERARPRPGPQPRRSTPSPAGFPVAVLIGLLALLVAVGAAAATVLPAASITIRRQPIAVLPLTYNVTPEVHTSDSSTLTSTASGDATGHRTRRTSATGTVLLINYSDSDVLVPADTVVSAGGEILFRTKQAVTVPDANFFFPGTATTSIEAVEAGPSGNVEARAIDRIEDKDVDRALRGPGSPNERRIRNDEPTEGGDERELLVVSRRDVEGVKDEITADLQAQFEDANAGTGERIYAGDPPKPRIDVPDDLLGHSSEEPFTFELTGRLIDERPYVLSQDAETAALEQLLADPEAAPSGATVEESSVQVELGEATFDGEVITLQATVTAHALRTVDEEALRSELAGKTVAEATAALAPIGPPTITLWPFWVDRVPRIDWRISIDVQAAESPS